MNNYVLAFILTLIAGLSTGVGSLISLFAKRTNKSFLAVTLGFSAGVMIYVSMIEIFSESHEILESVLGHEKGEMVTALSFFAGIFFMAIIDKLIPYHDNPHRISDEESEANKLSRMGIFTAIAIAIHNFPEGLATFVSATQDISIAIPIVVAVAIHNIPEGIAVSVPMYYATGSKKKAFIYSFLSGLTEPLGAIIGALILLPILNNLVFGIIFGMIAGIMVFISFDELLPTAREYGEHHLSMYGLIGGMAIMAISLIMFH